eukprot:21582-Heterococcus_DN1.PRE.2
MKLPVLEVAVLLVAPVALLLVAAAVDAVHHQISVCNIHIVIHKLASIAFLSALLSARCVHVSAESLTYITYKTVRYHQVHASMTHRSWYLV